MLMYPCSEAFWKGGREESELPPSHASEPKGSTCRGGAM